MSNDKFSLLYPTGYENLTLLNEITMHDLGFDQICKLLTPNAAEQNMILKVLSSLSDDSLVAAYRIDVFDDIYRNKAMRESLVSILEKIKFIKDFGSFKREYEDAATSWDLVHRLEEIHDYIECIEAIHACLSDVEIHSEGLTGLKAYVNALYQDRGFEAMKKDIEEMRATTTSLKSVTVGINLNERFEASEIGVVSLNDKYFTKAPVIGNFVDHMLSREKLKSDTEWNKNYRFSPFSANGPSIIQRAEKFNQWQITIAHPIMMSTMGAIPNADSTANVPSYMTQIVDHMLSITVKRLREVLKKYISVTITDITDLIPEFMYYIRWAEYIEGLEASGAKFCKASVLSKAPGIAPSTATLPQSKTNAGCPGYDTDQRMYAKGIYNLKLAAIASGERETIVTNDLTFDREHRVYLLTGANRGGKTTITQAIGQLFILAQGGIYIPGDEFSFTPVDGIYTHFPADEDKTMDLGRLGEECKRFKKLYEACTGKSLLLLNETFSTTSFEEGYYIAKDAVRAILKKDVRTLYNTHMHKLAYDVSELNQEAPHGLAQSLVVRSEDGKRSYKVEIAEPVGHSFAKDIAEKYGVTYEMLTNS